LLEAMKRVSSLVPTLAMTVVLFAAGVARAAEIGSDERWKPICAQVKDVAFPAADQPDDAAKKALKGCSSEGLFYGIGQVPDPQRARLCAYVELAAGD
jgi:hypothetical protein